MSEICGMELCAPRSVERGGGSSGEFSSGFCPRGEQGYAIELDIQITKDGRIVVFHDDTMKRMCGNEGKISDYTYEELQQFHLGDSTERFRCFVRYCRR